MTAGKLGCSARCELHSAWAADHFLRPVTAGKLGCHTRGEPECFPAADNFLRQPSDASSSSLACYAEPSQTLIFLDWDDTLFPTTELFKRWNVSSRILTCRQPDGATGVAAANKAAKAVEMDKMSDLKRKDSFGSTSTMDSLLGSFPSPFGRIPPQKKKPSLSEQLTAEHPSTGKQLQQQQPRRKAILFKNAAVRLMRRILSKHPSSKVSSDEEVECCQNCEVGVDVKQTWEEEDLSEGFAHGELTPEQGSLLKDWQLALFQYLTTACTLSSHVVIVTNSRRPWVETCVNKFAPNCKKFFANTGGAGSIKVVYAREVVHQMRSKRMLVSNGWDYSFPVKDPMPVSAGEMTAELIRAKFLAMHREAKAFYRRYKGQSWKNIISFGDMIYEHDAVIEMGMRRHAAGGSREPLRVKSLLLPEGPGISELTLSLCFSKLMLPVYVRFDGDLQLNLQNSVDPLQLISQALDMPEVLETNFPRHAWGRGTAPACKEELRNVLLHLEAVVQPS
ncbi:unnamed protein product [Polarella glacialis]|uniref:Uncharacterized protein n=1 Tax=Polarella glacialis TaxID=89957 RepID=A0A813K694_POLGL|nr:unnamed protein product [Polarella glacialis]